MKTIAPIKSLSLEKFYAYDDGSSTRYELVDGELTEMPTESPLNCDVARELFAQLLRFIPVKLLSYKEIMLEVSGCKVRVPDLMILGKECKAALATKTKGTITHDMPAPLVAIEVVSPGKINTDRDYRFKRSEYAARGVSEYWIVDPSVQRITILTLVEGFYEEISLGNEDKITSIAFPELEIRVSDIFS